MSGADPVSYFLIFTDFCILKPKQIGKNFLNKNPSKSPLIKGDLSMFSHSVLV